jgi:N-acetylglucosaminyldiphosphoundecaprenol N-acetyl-beta-D-mannosaminyltransferase
MRYDLLGLPIDALTFGETVGRAVRAIERKELTQHVAINVAKLVNARRNPELRQDIADSHIVGVDGMGIVWAGRLLGIRLPERVSGVDLMEKLLELCARRGFRPYLLGARQDVVEKAVRRAQKRWPGLDFAGFRNGYFRPEEEQGIVRTIRDSGADCLFIGMPTPRKERFLRRYRQELGVPFIMGVGGGIDVLAGHVRRAPLIMQRSGLEWLYRIYQEPGRMWHRYATTNCIFLGLVVRALMARLFAPDGNGRRLEAGRKR